MKGDEVRELVWDKLSKYKSIRFRITGIGNNDPFGISITHTADSVLTFFFRFEKHYLKDTTPDMILDALDKAEFYITHPINMQHSTPIKQEQEIIQEKLDDIKWSEI